MRRWEKVAFVALVFFIIYAMGALIRETVMEMHTKLASTKVVYNVVCMGLQGGVEATSVRPDGMYLWVAAPEWSGEVLMGPACAVVPKTVPPKEAK